jgi:hypothetical protein
MPEYKPGERQAIPEIPTTFGKAFAKPVKDDSVVLGTDGYESLARILQEAYEQSASGKGKERHANGLPFSEQIINTLPEMLGNMEGLGGLTYQVMKKTHEAVAMAGRNQLPHARKELLGAIVYAAAACLHLEKFSVKQAEE